MKPGPPKTPLALVHVRGNPGRRPLPKHEVRPEVSNPEPPDYLADVAKDEWRRVCPRLADLGLMSDIDIAVLAAYCGCYAELVEATEKQRGKTTVIITKNGNVMQSPYVSMIRYARADMVRFAGQLGMTPSARAGMDIDVGKQAPVNDPAKKNPAARFF